MATQFIVFAYLLDYGLSLDSKLLNQEVYHNGSTKYHGNLIGIPLCLHEISIILRTPTDLQFRTSRHHIRADITKRVRKVLKHLDIVLRY